MNVRTCVSYRDDIANLAMKLMCDTKFAAPVCFLHKSKKVFPKNFKGFTIKQLEWLIEFLEDDHQPAHITREFYASQGYFIQSILFDMDRLRVDVISQCRGDTGWESLELRLG